MDKNQLELNAILEITQAINNNMSESNLYKVFEHTCTSLLSDFPIGLVVVVKGKGHVVIANHFQLKEEIIVSAINLVSNASEKCIDVSSNDTVPDINQLIRVRHKTKLLAVVLVGHLDNQSLSEHQLNLIKTVANIVMVAIENKRLARRQIQQEVMDRELSIAKKVQQNLVPDHLPSNDIYELFASYIPFGKVGGDYYDFVAVNPTEFLFCIGDVQGKGVPAALVMSNFQASFKALVSQGIDLVTIVSELNNLLYKAAKGSHFISFFVGYVDVARNSLTYVNAGHNPPILVRNDGTSKFLTDGTMLLGAMDSLAFLNLGQVDLEVDDLFFMFTDGVTEVFNNDNEEFGEERLVQVLTDCRRSSLQSIQESVINSLDLFRGERNYSDDLTTLLLRVF